jgi:hypothetical protein
LGVESGDPIGHKRFLALFAGGMLPIISLSFLHMLVKFEEDDKKEVPQLSTDIDIEKLSKEIGRQEAEIDKEKYNPTQEDIDNLQSELEKMIGQKIETTEEDTQVVTDEIKRLNYLRRDV